MLWCFNDGIISCLAHGYLDSALFVHIFRHPREQNFFADCEYATSPWSDVDKNLILRYYNRGRKEKREGRRPQTAEGSNSPGACGFEYRLAILICVLGMTGAYRNWASIYSRLWLPSFSPCSFSFFFTVFFSPSFSFLLLSYFFHPSSLFFLPNSLFRPYCFWIYLYLIFGFPF